MKWIRYRYMFSLLFFVTVLNAAEDKPLSCEAETVKLMTVKSSWNEIYTSAKVLPEACFDGYLAEGISETLVRKMGEEWSEFNHFLLAHMNDMDQKFMQLLFDSINATLNREDIKQIEKLTKRSCPSELAEQCRLLNERANEVLSILSL